MSPTEHRIVAPPPFRYPRHIVLYIHEKHITTFQYVGDTSLIKYHIKLQPVNIIYWTIIIKVNCNVDNQSSARPALIRRSASMFDVTQYAS